MKVKCLSCQYLEMSRDPEGAVFRCGHGFFDTPEGIKVYYNASGLVHGNVGIWKAEKVCDYKVAERELGVKVYARPKGTHYHTTTKCPLLSGKVRRMDYVEVTWAAVRERKLRPCSCVKGRGLVNE